MEWTTAKREAIIQDKRTFIGLKIPYHPTIITSQQTWHLVTFASAESILGGNLDYFYVYPQVRKKSLLGILKKKMKIIGWHYYANYK